MVIAKNISVEFGAMRERKGIRMRRVISVTVDKHWQSLTGKAVITISKYIKGYDPEKLKHTFRVGDPVVIYAGYNSTLQQEFKGYITRIKDDKHLAFECEDEMYQLKSGVVNFIKKNCKLRDIIEACLQQTGKQYTLDVADAELGSVRIKDMTPAEVLKEIADKYHIYTYFKDGVLVSGKVFQENNTRHILSFDARKNIKTHSLEFRRAEDVKVQVKVTSVLSDGTKLEATAGDADGQTSEISLFGIKNKADLQKKADDKLKLMKADGYSGDIDCFGIPFIVFGDEVELRSTKFPERDGAYYVDGTALAYGPGASIVRRVTVTRKAS